MTLKGIDISSNNGKFKPKEFTGDFVINKLTGGTEYVWKKNKIKTCLKHGLLVGAYHYAHEYNHIGTPKAEAEYFYKHFKKYVGKVIPILDYEVALNGKQINYEDIIYIEKFIKHFKKLSGVTCWLYCSKDVIKSNIITDWLKSNVGLWFAQYADNKITGYQNNPWTDNFKLDMNVIAQQYTSKGIVPGIIGTTDLNIFYGTSKQWLAYAKAK